MNILYRLVLHKFLLKQLTILVTVHKYMEVHYLQNWTLFYRTVFQMLILVFQQLLNMTRHKKNNGILLKVLNVLTDISMAITATKPLHSRKPNICIDAFSLCFNMAAHHKIINTTSLMASFHPLDKGCRKSVARYFLKPSSEYLSCPPWKIGVPAESVRI